MALKLHNSNANYVDGIKIEGDLGDLQVIEDESHNGRETGKNIAQTNNNHPSIPPNLIQNTLPVFNKVSVTDSENVQFGNNTYFNGPVTIKQVIQEKTGVDNASYLKTEDESENRGIQKESAKLEPKKILTWHKVTFSAVCITAIGSIIAIVLVLLNKPGHSKDTVPQPHFDNQKPSKMLNKLRLPKYRMKLGISLVYAVDLVVGSYYDLLQLIFMAIILLPITAVIFYYSLLTIERIGNVMICHIYCRGSSKCPLCVDMNCKSTEKDNPLLIAEDHLRIVPREDWLAQPVEGALTKIRQPIPWVIITHTATESCSTQSQCVYRVRLIQSFHIESRGWYDIGYNFLVGGDGSVYYGRGWDYEGAHTKGYNKYSVGIAFIGTFNNEPPPKQQIEACEKIIKQGVQLGKLAKDYKLFAHRQLTSTLSPGDQVYNIIKTWPHFVSNVTDLETLIPSRITR